MQEKQALIRAYTFFISLIFCSIENQRRQNVVHLLIIKSSIGKILVC